MHRIDIAFCVVVVAGVAYVALAATAVCLAIAAIVYFAFVFGS